MLSSSGNKKMTAMQRMRNAQDGISINQETGQDREIRMLKLQKQQKEGVIDFFAIHIFVRPKSWDNPQIMENEIANALGDNKWALNIAGIKYHKDSDHIKIEVPYEKERIMLQYKLGMIEDKIPGFQLFPVSFMLSECYQERNN